MKKTVSVLLAGLVASTLLLALSPGASAAPPPPSVELKPCPGGYEVWVNGNAVTRCITAGPIGVHPCPGGYYVQAGALVTSCLPGTLPEVSVEKCETGWRVTIGGATTECIGIVPVHIDPCRGGVQVTIGEWTSGCLPPDGIILPPFGFRDCAAGREVYVSKFSVCLPISPT